MPATKFCTTHCSHCKTRTRARLIRKGTTGRDLWRCSSCGGLGMRCRAAGCEAMARVEPTPENAGRMRRIRGQVHQEFCSAHRGELPSWEARDLRLRHIGDWKRLLDLPRSANLCKGSRIAIGAGAVIIGGTVIVLTGGAAAPAAALAAKLGAAGLLGQAGTGALIATLKGAALTSASLAKIGTLTGAVAGAKVAAGTVILGGGITFTLGGALLLDLRELLRDVKTFEVHTLTERAHVGAPETLLLNGLLSESTSDASDWVKGGAVAHGGAVRLVRWDANTATRSAAGLAGPKLLMLPHKTWVHGWKGAFNRTQKIAFLLADLITRTPADQHFVLNGHSLGGRISLLTMAELGRRGERRIAGANLLGSATSATDRETWELATRSLRPGARIINAWSEQDDVLGRLFRTAELGTKAAGRIPVDRPPAGVHNVDCSDLVSGHTQWKLHAGEVLRRAARA